MYLSILETLQNGYHVQKLLTLTGIEIIQNSEGQWKGDCFTNLFLIKLELEGANIMCSMTQRPVLNRNNILVTFGREWEGRGES